MLSFSYLCGGEIKVVGVVLWDEFLVSFTTSANPPEKSYDSEILSVVNIYSDPIPGLQNLNWYILIATKHRRQGKTCWKDTNLPRIFHITNGLLLLACHSQTVNLVYVSPLPKKPGTSTNTNSRSFPVLNKKSPFQLGHFFDFLSIFLLDRPGASTPTEHSSVEGATRIIIKSLELAGHRCDE